MDQVGWTSSIVFSQLSVDRDPLVDSELQQPRVDLDCRTRSADTLIVLYRCDNSKFARHKESRSKESCIDKFEKK